MSFQLIIKVEHRVQLHKIMIKIQLFSHKI